MTLLSCEKTVRHSIATRANGGTEYILSVMERNRNIVPPDVWIHFSRIADDCSPSRHPKKHHIFYCHDLAGDPFAGNAIDNHRDHISEYVFVSDFQRNQFIEAYGLPRERCHMINNASDMPAGSTRMKRDDPYFIYHTTPHRGLDLLYRAFIEYILPVYPKARLKVFSSFEIYGWPDRDRIFFPVFKKIDEHPQMEWHGFKPRDQIFQELNSSDVFMYPCIWTETSCISLIEAARSGLTCVVPDRGALFETGHIYPNVHFVPDAEYKTLEETISMKTIDVLDKLGEPKRIDVRHHDVTRLIHEWDTLLNG